MNTRAVRMYGANDLRIEEFNLPEIKQDEILVKIITDSICMSTYKLLKQGADHKRCPKNVATNPIIIGHEFSGTIVEVGDKWKDEFKVGERFALQPALNYKGSLASPGYSYEFFGGAATYAIIPQEVMELGCLLHYDGEGYYNASLGEPMSCIIGGYNIMYHTNKVNYDHAMGIKEGGNVLILGGCGPMGLGAIEYPIVAGNRPKRIVVTDVDNGRIERAKELITPEYAKENGVELYYINPNDHDDPYKALLDISQGAGYDDVFVYAPIKPLAELGDKLMAFDGCLNFFAGPTNSDFTAEMNLYNVHYISTHILGSTGGNTDDLKEAIELSSKGSIRPSVMVSHICGLSEIADTTAILPDIRAGKILGYTQFDLPLVALTDFEEKGKTDPLFAKLYESINNHSGLWNAQAEKILLNHFGVE